MREIRFEEYCPRIDNVEEKITKMKTRNTTMTIVMMMMAIKAKISMFIPITFKMKINRFDYLS